MTVEELQAAIKKAAGLFHKNDTAFFALMDRVDHDDAVCISPNSQGPSNQLMSA